MAAKIATDETAVLVNCYRLEALGNTTRLAIFRLLVRAGERGLAVGDIQRALAIPASTLSHHLQRLVHVGLMSQERRSRVLVCRADFAAIHSVVEYLTEECCADDKTFGEGAGAARPPAKRRSPRSAAKTRRAGPATGAKAARTASTRA